MKYFTNVCEILPAKTKGYQMQYVSFPIITQNWGCSTSCQIIHMSISKPKYSQTCSVDILRGKQSYSSPPRPPPPPPLERTHFHISPGCLLQTMALFVDVVGCISWIENQYFGDTVSLLQPSKPNCITKVLYMYYKLRSVLHRWLFQVFEFKGKQQTAPLILKTTLAGLLSLNYS